MLLETLLQERGQGEITHIFKRKNVTFFKLHGESFCTAAGKVAHQSSHIYDSGFLHAIADEAHDAEVAAQLEAKMKDAQAEDDLWHKHRIEAMSVIMELAIQALKDKGPDVMVAFLDMHLEIHPTEETIQNIVKRIERGG